MKTRTGRLNTCVYTGELFEKEVAGQCLWISDDYVPFKKAMAIVKESQPGDPSDPSSLVMNDLQALICESLGEEDYSQVKIYTAVGSSLDRWHGIDVFVQWREISFVTIDLTVNVRKDEHKADIILHDTDVYTADGKVNRKRLDEIAHDMARLMKCRMPRQLVTVR